jgi:hypothetical protein
LSAATKKLLNGNQIKKFLFAGSERKKERKKERKIAR